METGIIRLADRLGMTVHVSPLRMKLRKLQMRYPVPDARCLEDWLLDVANVRGARLIVRRSGDVHSLVVPPEHVLSNEELVVAICQLESLDRPQMIRVAGQLISREVVEPAKLILTARRERVGMVLAEMARQALRVESDHDLWNRLRKEFDSEPRPRSPIVHWTRMAEPVPGRNGCNAQRWKLVA